MQDPSSGETLGAKAVEKKCALQELQEQATLELERKPCLSPKSLKHPLLTRLNILLADKGEITKNSTITAEQAKR